MVDNDLPSGRKEQEREKPKRTSPPNEELDKEAASKEAKIETCEPAKFPKGFWKWIDYLLHHPGETVESIRRDTNLWQMACIFFLISLFMSMIYGMVMGATNLLQGSSMPMGYKLLMILVTCVKVPALYLLTLVIVLPAVYVSNAFLGPGFSFRQMVTLMLATVAITGTVLASGATIALFFALTSTSYHFIKLLHVLVFVCASLAGLMFLVKCIMRVSPSSTREKVRFLFVAWLILYMFVGTQLAWVLRPFVGSPKKNFELFRKRKGNFYESVYDSILKSTGAKPETRRDRSNENADMEP